jgi:mono/diheme cytochrome c family protein
LLAAVADTLAPITKGKSTPRRVRMTREPAALAVLLKSKDEKIAGLAQRAATAMSWPNKPGDTMPPLTPLSEEQAKRFNAGRELFSQICAVCHQPSGLGLDGVAPPLVDSEWVLGPPPRVARIVLQGLHGPVKVGRKTIDLEMPGLKAMDDEQLASILTYIRREWGHEGNPIDPQMIARVRAETNDRGDEQWTEGELLKIK